MQVKFPAFFVLIFDNKPTFCGLEGTRTPYLRNANAALYQVSYKPRTPLFYTRKSPHGDFHLWTWRESDPLLIHAMDTFYR